MVGKTNISNFADDITIYFCGSKLPLILNDLEHDIENLLGSRLIHLQQTQGNFK